MDQRTEHHSTKEHLSREEEQSLLQLGKEITSVGKTVRASMYFRITSKEKVLTYIEHKANSWRNMLRSVFSRQLAPVYAMLALVAFVVSSVIPVGVLNEVYASQIGTLTTHYGVVRVMRDGQEIVVEKGEHLFIGDEVQVDAGAQASLEFIDSSSGVLKENSSIAITEVLINPVDPENSQVNLALREGNFHVETGKNKIKEGTSLRVDTPSGVIATTQGSFSVAVENSGATEVVAYSDSVTILSKDDGALRSTEAGGTIAMIDNPVSLLSLVTEESLPSDTETQTGQEEPSSDVVVEEPVVEPVSAVLPPMLSVSEVNDLRTKLYFAEIKLQQAHTAFVERKLDQALVALYDYEERLLEVERGYFSSSDTLPSRTQTNLVDLLGYRRSSTVLVQVRGLSVDANALSVYRDALLYLRRMVTLEGTLRQEVPLYLANAQGTIAPDALVYRLTKELTPVVEELLALEQQRTSNAAERHVFTPKIEEYIARIASDIMKQSDVAVRPLLLEEVLRIVPNTSTYTYMVLRFKIHFPQELHKIIDAKAAQMK